MTLGEAPRKTTSMVEFIVVDGRSAYKVIIRRSILLLGTKAITSIYHLCMKVPTKNRVGVVLGN